MANNTANTNTMWDDEVVDVGGYQSAHGPNADSAAPLPTTRQGYAQGIATPAANNSRKVGRINLPSKVKTAPVAPTEAGLMTQYRGDRRAGMAEGLQFGSQYFGGGRTPQQLNQQTGLLMDQYQGMARNGMDDPQFSGMRRQALGGLDQSLNEGLRNLNVQQGASGVRGAAGMAGKQNMMQQGQMARAGLEDQMLAQSAAMKERGMAGMGDMLNGERSGLLSSQLGMGNMYAQDRANAQQQLLGQAFADQAKADLDQSNVHGDNRTWLEKQMDMKKWDPKNPNYMIGGGNNMATNPAAATYSYMYDTLGPGSY